MLPVNEMFETIQGEAYWTGMPSLFIRLQGCGVGCPWCDTKHTWSVEASDECSLEAVQAKTADSSSWAKVDEGDLVAWVKRQRARHIVLTGGEPCDYDLSSLTTGLIDMGCTVQIETSGTAEIICDPRTWVTVSPKVDMPGGKVVLDSALFRANEIKMPVGKLADMDKLRGVLARLNGSAPLIWLQPLSQSEKATALCVELATQNGWRLSMQTHKYLDIR